MNWEADRMKVKRLHRKVINLISPLTYSDLMQIRTPEYWQKKDKLKTDEERLLFIIESIESYRFSLVPL